MKPYRFENAPLLKAFSERPGSDNELDRRRVNERRNRIETDAVTNETASVQTVAKILCDILAKFSRFETPTKRTGDYFPLHVIGRCLGTPKFKGEKDD